MPDDEHVPELQDPPSTTPYRVDMAVTVLLFVVAGLAVPVALVGTYLLAALSKYGCGAPSSTANCSTARPLVVLAIEFVLLVAFFVLCAIAAARVRSRQPRGWLVGLGAVAGVGAIGVVAATLASAR
uniref:Uncharacterized protein n=1 Tax=Neobacillus citreus TaxID=2833578 RepID=A0A942T249_9BACI